jgi:hypothetical protein
MSFFVLLRTEPVLFPSLPSNFIKWDMLIGPFFQDFLLKYLEKKNYKFDIVQNKFGGKHHDFI